MPIKIPFDESSLENLNSFIILGPEKIAQLLEIIDKMSFSPLQPQEIISAIQEDSQDFDIDTESFIYEVLSLCSLKRSLDLSSDELFDSIYFSIKQADAKNRWTDDKIKKLQELQPNLVELFKVPRFYYLSKAQSLKYDYQNLHQSIKIVTDIRPVYNEDGTEIEGAITSYLLRLYYQNVEGRKSLSISMDDKDVHRLLESCQRALTKAKTAKSKLERAEIKTIIFGEED